MMRWTESCSELDPALEAVISASVRRFAENLQGHLKPYVLHKSLKHSKRKSLKDPTVLLIIPTDLDGCKASNN